MTFLLSIFSVRCTEEQQLDFAQLERQLTVIWIANEWADAPVAAQYNQRAQASWRQLGDKYRNLPLTGQEKAAVRAFSLWMMGLNQAVENGRPRGVAMHLEHLRNTLTELRTPYGFDHPADRLYAFYRDWERVAEVTNDQMMCLLEWSEYEGAYHQARRDWRAFSAPGVSFHDTLFPGLSGSSAQAESAHVGVDAALVEFERVLQNGNHTLAVEPCEAVRQRFFHYLAVITEYPFTAPTT